MALPATPIYWKALLLWDPQLKDVVRNSTVEFFLEGDATFSTPQELWDYAGVSLGASLTSNDIGYCVPFVTDASTALVVKAGEYVDHLESIQGVREDVEAARDAALAAAAAAGALAAAGSGAGGISGAPPEWPTTFPPSQHSHRTTDLVKPDGTTPLASLILTLLAAADAQSARAAIGAGTSSQVLVIGTQPGQVAAGDHLHSQYMTQTQVQTLIAQSGGGGSAFGSNIWGIAYVSGAYEAVPAHVTFANGYRFLLVAGPVPYTVTPPTGITVLFAQTA